LAFWDYAAAAVNDFFAAITLTWLDLLLIYMHMRHWQRGSIALLDNMFFNLFVAAAKDSRIRSARRAVNPTYRGSLMGVLDRGLLSLG